MMKEYFCYECNKKFEKMVVLENLASNPLTCESCGGTFCQLIDDETDISFMPESE